MVHACYSLISFHMHAPIMEFLSEGSRPYGHKTAWATLFFSPQLILLFTEGGPMVLLQRKLYFPKDPEGSNISSGRSPTFSRRGGRNLKC